MANEHAENLRHVVKILGYSRSNLSRLADDVDNAANEIDRLETVLAAAKRIPDTESLHPVLLADSLESVIEINKRIEMQLTREKAKVKNMTKQMRLIAGRINKLESHVSQEGAKIWNSIEEYIK